MLIDFRNTTYILVGVLNQIIIVDPHRKLSMLVILFYVQKIFIPDCSEAIEQTGFFKSKEFVNAAFEPISDLFL